MRSWLGVDVGGRRKGFDVALVDERRVALLAGGLDATGVVQVVAEWTPAVVAIDGPRGCAEPGATTRDGEKELARAVCGIRWTPDEATVRSHPLYGWVVEGLALFAALADAGPELVEVFPTASFTRWIGSRNGEARARWTTRGIDGLGLDGVPPRTNQDQRDAIAAAVTARQYARGETERFGTIEVPR